MKKLLLTLSGLVLAATLASCGPTTPAAQEENISYMEATYPVYSTLNELVAESPLIIRGKVTGLLPSYRVLPEGIDASQLPAFKAAEIGYLMTDVEVMVERVLAGRPEAAGQKIVIQQLGGMLDGQIYVMKDEPLSEPNRSYVFFLQEAAPGRYVIVGGAQGRFDIRSGRLTMMSDEAGELPVVKYLNRRSYRALEADFRGVVNAYRLEQATGQEADEMLNSPTLLPNLSNKPAGPPESGK